MFNKSFSLPRFDVWSWTKGATARDFFRYCRWLHVYSSTALFSLLIFFCITGVLLNHSNWISAETAQGTDEFQLPAPLSEQLLANPTAGLPALELFIEQHTDMTQASDVSIDRDAGEITFDYPLPAGFAFVTVLPEEGLIAVDYEKGNVWQLLNDLHKGRHTGPVWSWVIDISAAAIFLFSITGLIILLQATKFRSNGLYLMAAGFITPLAIYLMYVPSYG